MPCLPQKRGRERDLQSPGFLKYRKIRNSWWKCLICYVPAWVIYSSLPPGPSGCLSETHTHTYARGQHGLLSFLRGGGEGRVMAWGLCCWPQPDTSRPAGLSLGLIHTLFFLLELSVLLLPGTTPGPVQDSVEASFSLPRLC